MAWINEIALLLFHTGFVVANNASASTKAAARVAKVLLGARVAICDGVADNVDIQAVLAAVLALGGGKVKLSEGTFKIILAILPSTKVDLEGCGQATILDATAGDFAGANGGLITVTGVTDLTLSHFAVKGNVLTAPYFGILYDAGAARTRTEYVEVSAVRDDGFAVSGAATDTTISHCIAHDIVNTNYPGTRAGFEVDGDGCKRTLIEYCESYGNGIGIAVHTHPADTVGVQGVRLIGNNCHNNGVTTQDNHKYEMWIMGGSTITNLVFDVVAIGNYLENGVNGCYISGVKNTIFSDNIIKTMSGFGLWIQPEYGTGIIATENILDAITGTGILTSAALSGGVVRVRDNFVGTAGTRYNLANDTDAWDVILDVLMDVLALDTDYVRSNQNLSGIIPLTFTIDAQPDVPRTITWAFDTHAQITAFTLVIVAVDAMGVSRTETFTEASGWSGETSFAYLTVTSITFTRTGSGIDDTMDIGIGSKVGPHGRIDSVLKIKKNNAHMAAANYTVSTTYNTVDPSTGGAVAAGTDLTIWTRQLANR